VLRRLVCATVCFAAIAAVLSATVAGATGSRVYIASKRCRGHVVRPSSIWFDCSGGGEYVSNLKYSSYGGSTAKATGLFSETCAHGCRLPQYVRTPGSITLKHVIRCDGRSYYGVVAFRYHGVFRYRGATQSGNGAADIGPSARCPDYGGG
jgi:hypothetical protein